MWVLMRWWSWWCAVSKDIFVHTPLSYPGVLLNSITFFWELKSFTIRIRPNIYNLKVLWGDDVKDLLWVKRFKLPWCTHICRYYNNLWLKPTTKATLWSRLSNQSQKNNHTRLNLGDLRLKESNPWRISRKFQW